MHINNPLPKLMLRLQKGSYGKKCRFWGLPVIAVSGGGKISIGSHLTLASGFFSNLVGLYQRSVLVARGGEIVIGDHVAMSGVTVYAMKRIEIGDHTCIGVNTKIFDSDFHPVDPAIRLQSPNSRAHTAMKETVIGKNVFIGCNALILKGVRIGDNAVVGAGSVVTRDVPENCIVAGNPARIVKKLEE